MYVFFFWWLIKVNIKKNSSETITFAVETMSLSKWWNELELCTYRLRVGRSGERIQMEANRGVCVCVCICGRGWGWDKWRRAAERAAKLRYYKWRNPIFCAQRVLNYWTKWKGIHLAILIFFFFQVRNLCWARPFWSLASGDTKPSYATGPPASSVK